jgi:ADP-heptose:LPS heptosyltransferase
MMHIRRSDFSGFGNYVLAVLSELLSPLLSLFVCCTTPSRKKEPDEFRHVLIVGNDHMGDVLYRTASLDLLSKRFPNWHITYATSGVGEMILTGNPAVHAVLRYDKSLLECSSAIKNLKIDAVLCTNSVKYWPQLLISIFLGIPNRVAYTHKGFSGLVSHPIIYKGLQPLAVQFREYCNQLTSSESEIPVVPRVYPSIQDHKRAGELFERLNPGCLKVVALFVTDRQPNSLWPIQSYKTLLSKLAGEYQLKPLLLGAANERSYLKRFEESLGMPQLLVEESLNPLELAAFLKLCTLVITKDSGPRHLANAVGTPVIFFRSLSHRWKEASVYCDTEWDLCPEDELVPESAQAELLEKIAVETVLGFVDQALQAKRRA